MKDRFNFHTDLPLVQWASGSIGFHGEGYWYHKILNWLPGFTKEGLTPVMKTVTRNERKGNTPIDPKTFQPKELFPKSIWVRWFRASPVNAVGLTNWGIEIHHTKGDWGRQLKPFYISIMGVGMEGKKDVDIEDKIYDIILLTNYIEKHLDTMPNLAGIQINLSCGNTGRKQKLDTTEAIESLNNCMSLRKKGLHIIPKLAADTPIEAILEISKHPAVTAIALSNAVQYQKFSDEEKRDNLFFNISSAIFSGNGVKIQKSKLVKRVGLEGSVSGVMLFDRVVDLLENLKPYHQELKPLIIGGGIISVQRLKILMPYIRSVDKIALGSVIFLRPWRIKSIRDYMNKNSPKTKIVQFK